MPTRFNSAQIDHFRNEAKRLARDRQIPHTRALDEIAVREGFRNWALLAREFHAHPDAGPTSASPFRLDRDEAAWRSALRTIKGADARKPETIPSIADLYRKFASPAEGVQFALEYMAALLARPRYYVAPDSQAHAEMRWWLPYCVHEIDDHSDVRLILNRHYKPIGYTADEHVVYEDFSQLQGRFDVQELRSFSFRNEGSGYLYIEGWEPWRSRGEAQNYVARLQVLEGLCATAAKRSSSPSWTHHQNSLYERLAPWARIATWFTGHPTDERRLQEVIEDLGSWWSTLSLTDVRVALQQHRLENPELLGGKASEHHVDRYARRIVEAVAATAGQRDHAWRGWR